MPLSSAALDIELLSEAVGVVIKVVAVLEEEADDDDDDDDGSGEIE